VAITSNEPAQLTARAGILRAGTGRAGAIFKADEMDATGLSIHTQAAATTTAYTTVASDSA